MRYRDRAVVTRAGGGTQDPVTGEWTGVPAVTVYDGPCRVQAGGLIRANRRSTSTVLNEADGVVFLPPWELGNLLSIEPGDSVELSYAPFRSGNTVEQRGASAEAMFVRPEDRAVLVRYR